MQYANVTKHGKANVNVNNANAANGLIHGPIAASANVNAIEQTGTLTFLTNLEQGRYAACRVCIDILHTASMKS